MMKKNNKVMYAKTPTGINTRVSIPDSWIKSLGITENDREVTLILKNDKIIIEKIKTEIE